LFSRVRRFTPVVCKTPIATTAIREMISAYSIRACRDHSPTQPVFVPDSLGQTAPVRRLPLIVVVAGLLTACGGSAKISTATGGSFRAYLTGNSVTVVFGATVHDAHNINQAYRRFKGSNVGIDDVLFQQGNAVMLWHLRPGADLTGITDCLK
jgi:hypothetical protein